MAITYYQTMQICLAETISVSKQSESGSSVAKNLHSKNGRSGNTSFQLIQDNDS